MGARRARHLKLTCRAGSRSGHQSGNTSTKFRCRGPEVVPGLVEVEVAVPPLETCLW